jgi:hypothetical protein
VRRYLCIRCAKTYTDGLYCDKCVVEWLEEEKEEGVLTPRGLGESKMTVNLGGLRNGSR